MSVLFTNTGRNWHTQHLAAISATAELLFRKSVGVKLNASVKQNV